MATALDIITDALVTIGAYAVGDAINSADTTVCLSKLNDMLDSWSNESLAVIANQTQSFAMQPGVAAYTIGPTGTWGGTRPIQIDASEGAVVVIDNQGNLYLVDVVEQDQWNLLGNKTIETSTYPDTLFYDAQYPNGIINLFPTPSSSFTLQFQSRVQLTDFGTLNTALSLPIGYKKALQDNLALEIWSIYKPDGTDPSRTMIGKAMQSKGNIKRTNLRANPAGFDASIGASSARAYNIYSDAGR